MRENEAALYLNVNARTLYRYRKSGKLAFREATGKTRPVIDYDEADIKKLKQELDRRRESLPKPASPSPPAGKRISFRMPTEGYEELSREAAKYEMTVAEYARRLVREGLESRFHAEAEELRAEVKRLTKEINVVRNDVAGAFEVVLEHVGLSADEAKQWVTENLR